MIKGSGWVWVLFSKRVGGLVFTFCIIQVGIVLGLGFRGSGVGGLGLVFPTGWFVVLWWKC